MRKHFIKKAAATFLSAALVISLLPVSAAAVENGDVKQKETREDIGKWKLQEWGGSDEIAAGSGWD